MFILWGSYIKILTIMFFLLFPLKFLHFCTYINFCIDTCIMFLFQNGSKWCERKKYFLIGYCYKFSYPWAHEILLNHDSHGFWWFFFLSDLLVHASIYTLMHVQLSFPNMAEILLGQRNPFSSDSVISINSTLICIGLLVYYFFLPPQPPLNFCICLI